MADEITTAEEDAKRSINWSAFIVWPFMIVLLYVLSLGPVVMLDAKGSHLVRKQWVEMLYGPLAWAYERTPLRAPLRWYLHLWDPKDFDTKDNRPR